MKLDIDKEMAAKMIKVLEQVMQEETPVKKKRGRPRKKPTVEKAEKVTEDEEDQEDEPEEEFENDNRNRRIKKSMNSTKRGIARKKNKRAKIESLTIGKRKNKFFDLVEEDVDLEKTIKTKDKDDKILQEGYKKRQRRAPVELVEVECEKCHVVDEVFPSAIPSRSRYLCNDCACGK